MHLQSPVAPRACVKRRRDASRDQHTSPFSGYTNCYFGKAFDAVKEDFDELVVAATSAQLKIAQAQMVGQGVWTKDVVDG